MLKYAAINTLFAVVIMWAIAWAIWLCVRFMWLLIPFAIIGLFIWFCIDYDKGNED